MRILFFACLSLTLSCASQRSSLPQKPTADASASVNSTNAPVGTQNKALVQKTATQGEDGESTAVMEKVTVNNPTSFIIRGEIKATGPNKESANVLFGPIPAGESGTATIKTWPGGSFVVTANWESAAGKKVVSRPFQANLAPEDPITPVSLTFNIPYSSGTLGVWKSVEWEPPADQKE